MKVDTTYRVIPIDKPMGISSHRVVSHLRKHLGMKRIGHNGTLDPMATGLVLGFCGRACRYVDYVKSEPKEYIAEFVFGYDTDSYDATGVVTSKYPHKNITKIDLSDALTGFTGNILQEPPPISALKHKGKPLYTWNRDKVTIRKPARNVKIFSIDIEKFEYPNVTIKVKCGSGTYIRSIVYDLGKLFQVGACLTALKRTRIGDIFLTDSCSLENLDDMKIFSVDSMLMHYAKIDLTENEFHKLDLGQKLTLDMPAGFYRLYLDRKFVGLGAILSAKPNILSRIVV